MGHRLTKIYTRTGDDGTTGLGDGRRIDKDHPRLDAIGDLDELNSAVGVILTCSLPDQIRLCLVDIQHQLFDIGAELSIPEHQVVTAAMITHLESVMDTFNADLPPLKEFILPGGNPAAAACQLARAICRRAERHLFRLNREETLNHHTLVYMNRLSDLLFVIARILTRETQANETQWKSNRQK